LIRPATLRNTKRKHFGRVYSDREIPEGVRERE
jgi:hypothetical protein